MDLTGHKGRVIQNRRKVNADGSITVTSRVKPKTKKKVVIARGKGEKTVGAVIASQLLPFRNVMELQLNKRGFNTSRMDFKNVIPLYYNEFVSNKENTESPFVPINSYEFCNHVAYRIKPNDNINGDLKDFRNMAQFSNFNGVVDNIVSIFKYAKLKKRAAQIEGVSPKEVMTTEEIVQANAAEKIERDLENKALNGKALRVGQFKNVLIIGLIIFILYKYL